MVKAKGNNHIDIESGSFSNGKQYSPAANERNVTYQYTSDVTFYANQVVLKDSNNIKHIESIYVPPADVPNFTQANTNNYKAEKIYITNVVHNVIPGLTEENNSKMDTDGNPFIIGELIIEHSTTSASDNGSKLYSCFFLTKNNTGDVNNIDSLIAMVDKNKKDINESLNIGKNIPTQTESINYNSKGNKVVVFFAPIPISNDSFNIVKDLNYDMSQQFLATNVNIQNEPSLQDKTKTFIYTNTNVRASSMGVVAMGAVTENDESYLECTPTGEGPDTIATYHVPINSEYTKDASRMESQQTLMNMITFSIIIGFVYVVVPPAYFQLVYVTLLKKSGFGAHSDAAGDGIRNFDWTLGIYYILLLVFAVGLTQSTEGTLRGPGTKTYMDQIPLYGICFFLLSFFAINNSKKNNGEFTRIFDYDKTGPVYDALRANMLPLSASANEEKNYTGFIPFFFGTLLYVISPKNKSLIGWLFFVALTLFIPAGLSKMGWDMAGLLFVLICCLSGYGHYVYT